MIDDLYRDWQEHGIQAIRAARESRPVEYLKVVAVIVSKCGDLSVVDDMRDAAVEQFIEERRQKAEMLIAKMREEPAPADATGKPWEGSGTA
jgi:uncharacterized pyridoxal phosphate-containing UPF0001 family protein